ncbi:MAG: ABC transporter substrate-binding protein [Actinobacteria bacterium]|nr:ABC transporter substrate-binding protein [Actinomycetota bacterium]
MKRTTVLKSAAVLGVASLALAACGGSSTSSESSSSAAAASSAAPAASSAAASAEASTAASAMASASADCKNPTLVVGSILPQTGDLAFLGPPEFAGVKKAVTEINAAGGVLGSEVTSIEGDSGDTTTDIASQTVDSHLSQGVGAIIGAASSGVSLTVIDKITSNGVLQMSPANTSPALTTYEDNGLYWRVAPSDALQGAVIAANAVDAGLTDVAVIARQDPYGEGLEKAFSKNFTDAGGTVTSELLYDPAAASFEAEVAEIKAGNPQAVVVIGFEETTKLMQEMIKQGVGPADVQIYLVDGNLSTAAYKDFPKGTMKGVLGTIPVGEQDLTDFNASLKEIDPSLEDFTYGAQAYDAMMLIALAAEAAGCGDGAAIAAMLPEVANTGGEKCTTFADCLALLQAGTKIDFDGVTGPLDFNQYGDPKSATIAVNEYSANDKFAEVDRVTAEVPLP